MTRYRKKDRKAVSTSHILQTPGWAEVHMAATLKDAARLAKLLEGGADVNARDTLLQTALHKAAFDGCEEIIALLIRAGADTAAHDVLRQTPAEMAEISGKKRIFDSVLKKCRPASPAAKKPRKIKEKAVSS